MTILAQFDFQGNSNSNVPGTVVTSGNLNFVNGALEIPAQPMDPVDSKIMFGITTELTSLTDFVVQFKMSHFQMVSYQYPVRLYLFDGGPNGTKIYFSRTDSIGTYDSGIFIDNARDEYGGVVNTYIPSYFNQWPYVDDSDTAIIRLYNGTMYIYMERDGNIAVQAPSYTNYGTSTPIHSVVVDGSITFQVDSQGYSPYIGDAAYYLAQLPTAYLYYYEIETNKPDFQIMPSSWLLSNPPPKFRFWFSDDAVFWGIVDNATSKLIMDFSDFCYNFDYDPTLYLMADGTWLIGHYGGQAFHVNKEGEVLHTFSPGPMAEAFNWDTQYKLGDNIYCETYILQDQNDPFSSGNYKYARLTKDCQISIVEELPVGYTSIGSSDLIPDQGRYQISGTVKKLNTPVAGAEVIWINSQGNPLQYVTTEGDGSYTLIFMTNTPKNILVKHPDGTSLVHAGIVPVEAL